MSTWHFYFNFLFFSSFLFLLFLSFSPSPRPFFFLPSPLLRFFSFSFSGQRFQASTRPPLLHVCHSCLPTHLRRTYLHLRRPYYLYTRRPPSPPTAGLTPYPQPSLPSHPCLHTTTFGPPPPLPSYPPVTVSAAPKKSIPTTFTARPTPLLPLPSFWPPPPSTPPARPPYPPPPWHYPYHYSHSLTAPSMFEMEMDLKVYNKGNERIWQEKENADMGDWGKKRVNGGEEISAWFWERKRKK
ncbi:unnamed protein product [Cuscuta epithymum]|uniref:Uncharacterized protein n=1 Tax=Cuscuta epithymum TaxID=186058 RepID=A0AAV0D9X4_9ASTE|nr:unnamed protein product [Cuscuta epithymum]